MFTLTPNPILNSVDDAEPRKAWNAFGHRFHDLEIDGHRADYAVVNERAVRATAGLMMVSAAVAFALAYFDDFYLPLQVFTLVAAADFGVRLFSGLATLSPFGRLGAWLVRRQRAEWVGATQKRFAWSLGLMMASLVTYLLHTGSTGGLSTALCLTCIALMWMEASLGICVGCRLFDALIRAGVIKRPENRPACPGGVCTIPVADSARA